MTYYESAENEVLTISEALWELRKHGVTDIEEFFEDLGTHEHYSAQTVLEWLGY